MYSYAPDGCGFLWVADNLRTTMQPSNLANQLATVEQLASSGSRLDGVPPHLENSLRFAGAQLTQAAGILMRLPQEVIAQALVVFLRFWVGPEGGSLTELGVEQVSAASIYLTTKLSPYPKSPRTIVNVYAYLSTLHSPAWAPDQLKHARAEQYYVSEGTYQSRRILLFDVEQRILKAIGFNVHVSLPYALCITYLQALDVFSHPRASDLARRATAHLNAALLSPQMLYLTHQPSSLATAAIYLAAKDVRIKLPDVEWWEVFDTDREELGFLVVAMLSVESFAEEEKVKWKDGKVPFTVEELEVELKREHGDE